MKNRHCFWIVVQQNHLKRQTNETGLDKNDDFVAQPFEANICNQVISVTCQQVFCQVLFRQWKLWLNIVVNKPLSRDGNETRRSVNDGHVTKTIIKYIMQYCWQIKTGLCSLQNKNSAQVSLHFHWPKRDETKCNNVISTTVCLAFCSPCSVWYTPWCQTAQWLVSPFK